MRPASGIVALIAEPAGYKIVLECIPNRYLDATVDRLIPCTMLVFADARKNDLEISKT